MFSKNWLGTFVCFVGQKLAPVGAFGAFLYLILTVENMSNIQAALCGAGMTILTGYFIQAWLLKRTKEEG